MESVEQSVSLYVTDEIDSPISMHLTHDGGVHSPGACATAIDAYGFSINRLSQSIQKPCLRTGRSICLRPRFGSI